MTSPSRRKSDVNLALEKLVTSLAPSSGNHQQENGWTLANGISVSQWWWLPKFFRAFLLDNGVKEDLSLKRVELSLGFLSKLAIIERCKFNKNNYYRLSDQSTASNVTPHQQQPQGPCQPPITQAMPPMIAQLRDRLNDALLRERTASNAVKEKTRKATPIRTITSTHQKSVPQQSQHDKQHSSPANEMINTETASISSDLVAAADGYVKQNVGAMLSFFQKMLQHGHPKNDDSGKPPTLNLKSTRKFGAMIRFHFECSTCREEFVFDTDCFEDDS
eukprot:scaffold5688_cov104-Cylindrotheca_fusiformis.AAC.6